jgi:hypothetical protein
VADSNTLVDSNDYRIAQTPQSGLSFGGSNGRSNAFFIDGVENYANSGGVRMSVSQEAVQEFQINRSSFSAEYGGAAGGTVNIVTRSGTNSVHGDFFRISEDQRVWRRAITSIRGRPPLRALRPAPRSERPLSATRRLCF